MVYPQAHLLGLPKVVPMKLNYQCELCGVKFGSVIPVDADKVPKEKRLFYIIGLCHECALKLKAKKKAKQENQESQ